MPVSEIESGNRYVLTNAKNTERVLDLSGADNRSIIGYGPHGGDNQKWTLERREDGWTLQNVATGLYAVVEGHQPDKRDYQNGTKVIGSQEPYVWHIWHEEGAFRVSVPEVKKSLDLSNHGAGPDVEIWGKWEGKNQLWYFGKGGWPRVLREDVDPDTRLA